MQLHALPLGAFYDFGNKIGPVSALVCALVIAGGVVFVMAKYLFGKDERNA
jgi:hypothetical protein